MIPEYIVPGAIVRLRGGRKARIYATDGGGEYPVHGAVWSEDNWAWNTWLASGACYKKGEHDLDIVGPWIDEPDASKLWPVLPPWIEWLAMDEGGEWYGYEAKPELQNDDWGHRICTSFVLIPVLYAPAHGEINWTKSLIRRPKS